MPTKMKPLGWKDRDRNCQLANILYSHLSDAETQKQMLDRASQDGEAKRAGLQRRMNEFGEKPQPPKDYSMVSGLRKVERK